MTPLQDAFEKVNTTMSPRQPRLWTALAATCALLWLVAGCGTDPTSERLEPDPGQPSRIQPRPRPPQPPTGCEEATALKSSLAALKDVNVRSDGVDALKSAIADVKTNLQAARTSASSVLRPELDQVQTAIDALQTATTGLTKDNLAQKAPQIATALAQVATAAASFTATLSKSCPAS